jgi:glycosyltransferase involved in cell wall biosynthesis
MDSTDVTSFLSELNQLVEPTVLSKNIIVQPELPTVKLLLVSTHVNQVNGYSKVAYNMLKELSTKPWLKLVHYATHNLTNADIGRKIPTVKVIDASALEKEKKAGFAQAELPAVLQQEKPDVVLIYNDLAMICSYIEQIKKMDNRPFKIWTYVDTTYAMQPQSMIDMLNRDVERIFCFTKSWKDSLKSQGINRPVDVLRHGVDTAIFKPIPKDVARQMLGLPKDVFLFTSINKNIPRKRLDILIMSFVKLIIRHPLKPIFLLIVANKEGSAGGYNLFEIFARELKLCGEPVNIFGDRLLITSTDTCYKDDDINALNNCGDAGISCAEGEGFGLCTFEQMAAGVPQVVPEINGYTEYCNANNSLLVKPKMRYYIPYGYNSLSGEAQVVDSTDVSNAMEQYVFDDNLRKLHSTKAAEVVSYTWQTCLTPLVNRLSQSLEQD